MRDLRVVLAPNPGMMTGPGTNQYLFAGADPVLIDVAPLDDENRRRLEAACGGDAVARLLLTHIHPDHVGGAAALRDSAGVPITVHVSRADFVHAGRPLAPDALLADGDEISHPAGRLRAVHTPGHESGHLCYYDPDRRWLFTGDTILSTGTTVVPPPPDGDMLAYLASLRRLQALDLAYILPGHGPPIERPYDTIAEYLRHRLWREGLIVDALGEGITAVPALVARVYTDVPPPLHGVAALTVRAHLAKLVTEGGVTEEPADCFRLR